MIEREHKTLLGTTGAVFSYCERYRYALWRSWDFRPKINFLMLNPSTADELMNDATVERCERRARSGGYGGLIVTNLFAIRATDPRVMRSAEDPVGPYNDTAILKAAAESEIVVCAWGNHGAHRQRSASVLQMLRDQFPQKVHALKVAKTGEPCHPLYLPYELKPRRFEA